MDRTFLCFHKSLAGLSLYLILSCFVAEQWDDINYICKKLILISENLAVIKTSPRGKFNFLVPSAPSKPYARYFPLSKIETNDIFFTQAVDIKFIPYVHKKMSIRLVILVNGICEHMVITGFKLTNFRAEGCCVCVGVCMDPSATTLWQKWWGVCLLMVTTEVSNKHE